MKKHLQILALIAAMCVPWIGQAQTRATVTVGTGTATSYNSPFNAYYKNSTNQTIYLASEINTAGAIDTIWYYCAAAQSITCTELKVYMGTTTASAFGNMYTSQDLEEVYSGTNVVVGGAIGWYGIPLDTPFAYNGIDNLVVCITKKTTSYNSSCTWQYTSTTNLNRYRQNDSDVTYGDLSALASGTAGTTSDYSPNTRFSIDLNYVPPTCPKLLSLTASNVDAHNATLTWVDTASAGTYILYFYPQTHPENIDSVYVYDTTYTITGLDANTNYIVNVVADCGTDGLSRGRAISFKTGCDLISSLPYDYGFEDAPSGTGSHPDCWTFASDGSGTYANNYYPYVYTSNVRTGSKCAYLYLTTASSTTAGYPHWEVVALPPVDTTVYPISGLTLDFWGRTSTTTTYSTSFKVGVMTDPTDTSTFQTVQTFGPYGAILYQEFNVNFANFEGSGNYIAIMMERGSTAQYLYADDFTLTVTPSCPRVENITMSNITPTSADLSWTEMGTATSYTLQVINGADTVVEYANDTTFTLTNLTPNTEYTVNIIVDCGSEVGGINQVTFRTACAAMEFPFVEDFESYGTGSTAFPTCWTKIGSTADRPYIHATTTYGHNNTHGLYFYAASATGYCYAVMPYTNRSIDSLTVTFWSRQYSTSYNCSFVVGVMTNPNDISTFVAVDTVHPNSTAYEEFMVSFNSYTGSGKYIAFSSIVNSGTNNYLMLDDVMVDYTPVCPRVEDVTVSNITPTSADLSWTETGTATSYTLQVITGTDTVLEYAYDTAFSLINLTPNTEYTVNITVDCGSEVGGTNQISFRTTCVAMDSLPYVYGFEDAATGTNTSTSFANCWNRLNNGTQYFGWPYVGGSTYAHSGSKGLYWYAATTTGTYGDYQCIVLPAIDTDIYPINTLQLSFWAKASGTSYNPTFQVGVMTDPMDINTFQQVGTVNVGSNTSWSEFSTAFGRFTGYGQYVAIRAIRPSSLWYAYVDDITLEEAPSCPSITNISATTTAGSALLSWDYDQSLGVTPSSYTVEYRYANDPLSSPNTLTVYEDQLLLSGLDPDSTYEVSIYADCGSATSAVETATFHMQALPCLEWDTTGTGGTSSSTATYSVLTSGTSTTNVMPVNGGYNYSYANHLYLASEINSGAVNLSGIDFQYAGTTPMVNTTNCSIYLCHTTMTTCDAFAPATDFQLVYVGPMNCTPGWNHFEFNRGTFSYNGTNNLMVGVVKNGTGTESNAIFYYATSPSSMSHRVYRNDAPYTLADMATATAGNSVWRPNMRLTTGGNGGSNCITQASCAAPNATITDLTSNEVSLRWIPGYQETSWDVDYRASGTSAWTSFAMGTSTDSITITGLNASTNYEVRVGSVCSDTTIYDMLTFSTPCAALTIPFTEDFEAYGSGTTAFPMCWYKKGSTADRPYIHATTSYGHNNTHGLYFYAASGGYCYAVMPYTDHSIDSLQVSFWSRQYSTSYDCSFVVGVMSDPNDITTFVPVDTVHPNSTTYEAFEVPLSRYTGSGKYIAFSSILHSGTLIYLMLDDVTVNFIPACPRVRDIVATSITGNSATINWTSTEADSYDVEYGPTGFTQGTGNLTAYITDDSIQLTGLTPNTAYDVYVRGNCNGDSSYWSFAYTFRTECGIIDSLPFTENFDAHAIGTSATSSAFIPCWTRLNNGTTYGGYPYVGGSTYNHTPGGNNGLYWYGSTTTGTYGDYQIIAMPSVDTDSYPMNTLQVKLWAKASNASYHPVLQIGVMSDPADLTTFQPVDTINVEGIEWQLFEVPLAGFNGIGTHAAIKATRPSSIWYAYVDDITLEEIPDCQHVTDVHATVVGLSNATIEWEAGDSTQTTFEVRYGVMGSNVNTLTGISVSGADTIALTGLDSATTYDVYVRADCGNSHSSWELCSITTLAASPVNEYPYTCSFGDAEGTRWDLCNLGQTNQWHVGTAAYNGTTDNVGLYISDNNGVNNTYTTSSISYSWASRTFDMAAGEYAYSFDWKCQGESANYDFFRVFLVPASEELTAGELPGGVATSAFATATAPAGWYDLSQRTSSPYSINMSATWQTLTGTVNVPTGTYKLAFAWANDGSGGSQPPAAIDNIYINRNTCPTVQNLSVDYISGDTIAISWNTGGEETEWIVECNGNSVSVYDSSYVISGLTPNTEYSIRVSSVCTGNDTSMAQTVNAHTSCMAMSIPYTENFDSYPGATTGASGVYPNCWDYVLTGSSTYQAVTYYPIVYTSSTYAHSGSNSLRLYGVGYFSLPPVNVPLDSLQLSFWNYVTSASYGLEVGVMEGNTFVPIQDVSASSTSTHFQTTIYLSNYHGTSRTLAFRNYYTTSSTTGYSYNYIDDIEIDYAPNCMPVYDIRSASASETTIDVDWTDASTATSWQIEYGAAGHAFGSGTTITTTVHPYTITGLDTLTGYDFYVRPICSSTDTGLWSDAATLLTSLCTNAHITSIGSTTSSSTAYYYPVNNYFKYTLSETIIDSAELGGVQDINMISFYYQYASASTQKTNCTIYFQPTNKTTFSSTSDIVALSSSAVKVYTGALNCSQGWNHFELDSAYHYDGTGNLLVIIDDNSNAYNGSTYVFKTAPCTGNKTLSYYSDSADPDVNNPSSFSGTKSAYTARVVMQLTSCGGAYCTAPVITSETHDYQSATITWAGSGSEYQVNVKESSAANWPANDISVTGNTYTFSGLNAATNYTFRVRQDCSLDSLGYSDWTIDGFTTDSLPCFAPSDPVISDITNATATIDWTVNGNETNWDVRVWFSGGFDSTYRTSTRPVTVGGLTPGVTYTVTVRPLCGINLVEGDWSNSATFTTMTCPDVTGLATSDVTSSSITLHWDADPMAQSWIVEYGYAGFTQGQGTTVQASTNSYVVNNLFDETAYDFHVKAVCGTDWNSEGWSNISASTVAGGGSDEATLTVTVNGNGHVLINGQQTTFYTGHLADQVSLTAVPDENNRFVTWSDGNTDAERTFMLSQPTNTLTATFEPVEGIDDVTSASCTIYPNPTSSATTISVSGVNGKVRIAIVDMNGREVATETIECASDCVKTMDVDNLAQGAYFVRITDESVNMVKKLIVR